MKKKRLTAAIIILTLSLVLLGAFTMFFLERQKTQGIELQEKNIRIPVGEKYVISAEVVPSTAKNKEIVLAAEDTDLADVSGKVITGKKAGSTVISALQNGVVFDQCAVTFYDILPTDFHFSKDSVEAKIGRPQKIDVFFSPADVTDRNVEYTVADETVLTIVNGNEILANNTGSTIVTAKHLATELTSELLVEVTPVELEAITIEIDKTISIGSEIPLTAILHPSDTTKSNLVWSTQNSKVASISDGKLLAKSEGKTIIKVYDKATKIEASVEISVIPVEVSQISLIESTTTVAGDSFNLTASIFPDNATNKKINWTSSNTDIATVKDGKVSTKKAGVVIIRAKSANGLIASCRVTVNPRSVPIKNGMVIRPSGSGRAPVKINAPTFKSVYVYFDCLDNSRNDFSMLVKAGTNCEVNAPTGEYKVYYASGDTWYGQDYKFGKSTNYFSCEGTVRFYTSGNYVYGTELTLYPVSNGNLETDEISAGLFPG